MDREAALAAFDTQLRGVVRPASDGGQYEQVGPVIRCLAEQPDGWSGVVWSDLDETSADQVIAEQIAYFRDTGHPFEWKYYGYDRPGDLPARLRAAGLVPEAEEALMVADVADVPTDLDSPQGIRFVTVSDEDGLRAVQSVHDTVFGGDHGPMIASMAERPPDAVAPVLALAGDVPVCAARVEFHIGTDFASLWGGGTVPDWRRRGIYRAMVGYRARLAAERGYRYLTTDALPTSRPILERLGFTRLTTTVPYVPA